MTKHDQALTRRGLLQLIESLSSESDSSDGTQRPSLALVVQRVMKRIDGEWAILQDVDLSKPIPVIAVASYVDGTLEDAQLERQITASAASDPGLMMEIVSAVDANRSLPMAVPDALRSRLLAIARQDEQDQTLSLLSDITSSTEQVRESSSRDSRQRLLRRSLIVATAAIVLLGVGMWIRTFVPEGVRDVAGDPGGNSITRPETDPNKTGTLPDSSVDLPPEPNAFANSNADPDAASELADSRSLASGGDGPEARDGSRRNPTVTKSESFAGIGEDRPSALGNSRLDRAMADEGLRPIKTKTEVALVRWEAIDGMMLTGPRSSKAESSSDTSLRAVQDGLEVDLANRDSTFVQFQTLPFCRATADLGKGGRIVLSSDTLVEVTPDSTIDLKYGSLAVANLNPAQSIRIGRTRSDSLLVGSSGSGTLLIERDGSGFQVEVHGTLKLNGQSVTDRSLLVEVPSSTLRDLGEAQERLPRWTRERVDRIELPRTVLAQIAQSDDASTSMMQVLASGKLKEPSMELLRNWLVVSNRRRLGRLIVAPDPMIREAAFRQLNLHRPGDPRHVLMWRGLSANTNGGAFANLRSFFVDLWDGRRPNATRKDQLVRLMLSPDAATRATTDYLLRSLYGGGPPFILNPSNAIRTRAANAWRSRISRLD